MTQDINPIKMGNIWFFVDCITYTCIQPVPLHLICIIFTCPCEEMPFIREHLRTSMLKWLLSVNKIGGRY